ncbi:MAG: hypothetical protein ACRDVL_07650 [Acidimicrobiia bacterium]
MTKMLSRAGRAAILDRKVFTEVFFDDDAMADAAIVVSLVGAATYLGALVWFGVLGAFSLVGLLQLVLTSVAMWLILGFATWFAATRLFGATNRPQTLIAMQGLAILPLLLEVFGGLLATAGLIWYLVVLVVATKEGTDLATRDAAVSVLIGFAAAVVIRALLGVPFAAFSALF